MKSRYRSSKALTVSFALHLIVGVIGFFLWPTQKLRLEQNAVNAVLMKVERPKTKRLSRQKRVQVKKQVKATSQTNRPRLKILTSNAPLSERGIASAAEPMPFRALDSLDLSGGLTTRVVTPQAMPQMERVITTPVKPKSAEAARPKSRLVKFIERQEGPQRIIYCVDFSSSMLSLNPRKFQRMLAIMADSLEFLEPHDLFNIMTFSGEIQSYRP